MTRSGPRRVSPTRPYPVRYSSVLGELQQTHYRMRCRKPELHWPLERDETPACEVRDRFEWQAFGTEQR